LSTPIASLRPGKALFARNTSTLPAGSLGLLIAMAWQECGCEDPRTPGRPRALNGPKQTKGTAKTQRKELWPGPPPAESKTETAG